MRTGTSFNEILQEKMGQSSPTESISTGADPAHLSYLLGQIGVFRFKKPAPPAMKKASSRPAPRARVQGPAHLLSECQKAAMEWFLFSGETLLPDFNAVELKQSFRRLALRLHPDVIGGSSEAFLQLKGHHQALKALVPTSL